MGYFKKNIRFILFIILVVALIILFYVAAMHIEGVSYHLRNITSLITVAIAAISLITTVYLTTQTSQYNKDNQNSNFLMGMMSNHYKMLESHQDKIDDVMEKLSNKINRKEYILDRAVKEFTGYIRLNDLSLEIEKLSDSARKYPKDFNILKKILRNNDVEGITRLLLSYYREMDKDLFHEFNESITKKAFDYNFGLLIKNKTDIFNKIDRVLRGNLKDDLTYNELCSIYSEVFDDNYSHLGHFFRNSYRIVKSVNEIYKDDIKKRKSYIGILRSQYSENTILAIYYNCVYTSKGVGYARELLFSDFFGDQKDLEHNDPIHFRKEKLFLSQDLRMIKKFFTSANEDGDLKKDLKKKLEHVYTTV